ncbi:MAG: pyridoxamine 5'-phosphate oxidase family protein [Chloroflexota bacterium]|nr:pyridoxamine 5'-phosphate oxidase family protein [Chloroflexota bacterium]
MADETTDPSRNEPRAGPLDAPPSYRFPKSSEGLLPWTHAVERLERARNYWLATTRPSGRPHVTPVWGVWVDGGLYFDGLPTTRWARNIAVTPAIAVHLESGDDVVIIEGVVEDLVTTADLAVRVIEAWAAKYGRLLPEPASSGIFRLQPRTARAWSSASLEDGTRWRFTPAADSTSQRT